MGDKPSDKLLYEQDAFRIRGAIYDVYRAMGAGFLEAVYHECLEIEFARRDIPFESRKPLALTYGGHILRQTYITDFVCFERIIIELKAVRAIAPEHRAQTINYLRATGLRLGLLVNFGATPKAEVERLLL
jgi:GxxExxY protein